MVLVTLINTLFKCIMFIKKQIFKSHLKLIKSHKNPKWADYTSSPIITSNL